MAHLSFIDTDADLLNVLRAAASEDLDLLVRYIHRDVLEELSKIPEFQAQNPKAGDRIYEGDHRQYVEDIAGEIQRYGGNSIVNLFRSGKGVPYLELACDLAEGLKIEVAKDANVEEIERSICLKILASAYGALTDESRRKLLQCFGLMADFAPDHLPMKAMVDILQDSPLAYFNVCELIASLCAHHVVRRNMRNLDKCMIPIWELLSEIETLDDFNKTSVQRVLLPCVIHVSYLRHKIKYIDGLDIEQAQVVAATSDFSLDLLNRGAKKQALEKLNDTISAYDENVSKLKTHAGELHALREGSNNRVIRPVEAFINKLAKSPKEFDASFAQYKAEFRAFHNLMDDFNAEAISTDYKAGGSAAAGVAAGVGTAALMPSAAMAIATTFGTASTGTAISALSGAAATNAALAWLGGGALAAGGGGMAAGGAFLALAGPIGIGIGASAILGGSLYASSKNKGIVKEANEKIKEIETGNATIRSALIEVDELTKLTKDHEEGLLSILDKLYQTAPLDYSQYSDDQKDLLGSLINHMQSLSKLLNKKVH